MNYATQKSLFDLRIAHTDRLASELSLLQKWRERILSSFYSSHFLSEPFADDLFWLRAPCGGVPEAEKRALQEICVYEYIEEECSEALEFLIELFIALIIILGICEGWRRGIIQDIIGFV